MADRLTPNSRVFLRDQIARVFPDRDSRIKFERMLKDLTESIPASVNGHADELEGLDEDVADLVARVEALEALGGAEILTGSLVVTVPAGHLEHTETVAAPEVQAGMGITLSLAAHDDDDENTAEMLGISAMGAAAGDGSITITIAFTEPTTGEIRFNYLAA